jgi:hypothetical protein
LSTRTKGPLENRAALAGAFKGLRERALAEDPDLLAIKHTAERVQASKLVSWYQQQLDADVEALVFDRDDPDARAVERMSTAAAEDIGYRVQLVDLAALLGGLYLEAVRALYAIEVRTVGRWEALTRLVLDQRQLMETRRRDAEKEAAESTRSGV